MANSPTPIIRELIRLANHEVGKLRQRELELVQLAREVRGRRKRAEAEIERVLIGVLAQKGGQ